MELFLVCFFSCFCAVFLVRLETIGVAVREALMYCFSWGNLIT